MNQHSGYFEFFPVVAIPSAFQLLVLFGGLAFCLAQVKVVPGPAKWASLGLSLFLAGQALGWLGPVVLARIGSVATFANWSLWLSAVLVVVNTLGILILIYAVFDSRQSVTEGPSVGTGKFPPVAPEDANPYTTPRSG